MTLAIANARGVPGTATALVTGPRHQRMVLACHHVVFGNGARVGERVWAFPPEGEPVPLGRASDGMLGRVGSSSDPHFIDCALVELQHEGDYPAWLHDLLGELVRSAATPASVGATVVKHGATTGVTYGAIASDRYVTEPWLEGKAWTATDQLLVDSADEALVFSASGDSGAALLDGDGSVVGLLWGTTPAGQGIACRIEPVLAHLRVELDVADPPKTYTASISIESSVNGGDGTGTLGCFAKDNSGTPVLLTCSHVVFPGFTAPPKQGVYTPSYSTCCGGDKIATLVIDPNGFDENGRYMVGFKTELGAIQIPAPASGGYTTSKPTYTCSHTDCAIARIDKGIQFTNTLPTSSGDIVIDGVEEDTDKLLGSTLLEAGTTPSDDHYVRIVTANHPNQIIWGTVMWKTAVAGDPGAFDLSGKKVTPLVHFGFTDSETKDALAGTLPSFDQFLVLPRPPPKSGVSDYTQLYSQTWIKGIIGGDSGSVVINSKDQVVGLVVRGQPYTATSLTKVGDRGAIEFQSVESLAVCNPIKDVLQQLNITIPGKPFTGTGSYVAPGSAGASISLFDEPQLVAQRYAMTALRTGLLGHRRGRLLVGKVNEHRTEIRRMFVRVRAVVASYRALEGPAWYLHCARSLREPGHTIPTSINGITRDRLADGLLPIVAAHGSPALKRDIELYGAWAREALLHVPTMRDVLAAVAGAHA